jgi:hypothetical protein
MSKLQKYKCNFGVLTTGESVNCPHQFTVVSKIPSMLESIVGINLGVVGINNPKVANSFL